MISADNDEPLHGKVFPISVVSYLRLAGEQWADKTPSSARPSSDVREAPRDGHPKSPRALSNQTSKFRTQPSRSANGPNGATGRDFAVFDVDHL